jgi:hypothetical protein
VARAGGPVASVVARACRIACDVAGGGDHRVASGGSRIDVPWSRRAKHELGEADQAQHDNPAGGRAPTGTPRRYTRQPMLSFSGGGLGNSRWFGLESCRLAGAVTLVQVGLSFNGRYLPDNGLPSQSMRFRHPTSAWLPSGISLARAAWLPWVADSNHAAPAHLRCPCS